MENQERVASPELLVVLIHQIMITQEKVKKVKKVKKDKERKKQKKLKR